MVVLFLFCLHSVFVPITLQLPYCRSPLSLNLNSNQLEYYSLFARFSISTFIIMLKLYLGDHGSQWKHAILRKAKYIPIFAQDFIWAVVALYFLQTSS